MKESIIFCLYLFGVVALNVCYAQDTTPKVFLTLVGGAGGRAAGPDPVVQNFGRTVYTYTGKPQKNDFAGTKYLVIDAQGEEKEIRLDELNFDAEARLSMRNARGHGWFLSAGYLFSRISFQYETITFAYKGRGLSRRWGDVENHFLTFGIAKYWNLQPYENWDSGLFVRGSGGYIFKQTVGGGSNIPINQYASRRMENGTGYVFNLEEPITSNWAVIPEFGMKVNNPEFLAEFSISAILPMSDFIFKERAKYYENNVLRGQAVSSVPGMMIALNMRLGLTVFTAKARSKPQRQYTPRPPRETPKPSYIPLSKFDEATITKPVELAVYFKLTKSNLGKGSFKELDELARWLTANPLKRIRLEGHTDKIGDATLNYELSLKRLDAVKAYLTKKGIAATRIETIGYGDTKLLYPSPDQRNRRVEMRLLN